MLILLLQRFTIALFDQFSEPARTQFIYNCINVVCQDFVIQFALVLKLEPCRRFHIPIFVLHFNGALKILKVDLTTRKNNSNVIILVFLDQFVYKAFPAHILNWLDPGLQRRPLCDQFSKLTVVHCPFFILDINAIDLH